MAAMVSGRASVVKSRSLPRRPSTASRTDPPTRRAHDRRRQKPAQRVHDITEVAQRHGGPGQQSRTSQIGLGHEVTAYRLQ